jgi:aspartyl protease family protein
MRYEDKNNFKIIKNIMVKLLHFFLFFFFTNSLCRAQDLNVEQTLNYLNKQLNNKDNKSSATSYEIHWKYQLYVDVWNDDYSYNIRIEQGILIITKTFSCMYFDNVLNHGITYTPVIEELSVPVNLLDNAYDYSSSDETVLCTPISTIDPSYFILHTKDQANPSVTKIAKIYYTNGKDEKKTEKLSSLAVEFSNDNLVCDKIHNAFVHLLNLLSKDTSYNIIKTPLETDPFANSVKKNTTNPNAISTTNSNSVPMTKTGGVYQIPVIINGALKLNFIFDAGASNVSVSADVALTLIRTGTLTDADFLGTETFKFADGSTAKSKMFLLKEIQIGNQKVRNVKASIASSIKAPLLLGQSVLNKFGKVTIDYKKGVIIFQN